MLGLGALFLLFVLLSFNRVSSHSLFCCFSRYQAPTIFLYINHIQPTILDSLRRRANARNLPSLIIHLRPYESCYATHCLVVFVPFSNFSKSAMCSRVPPVESERRGFLIECLNESLITFTSELPSVYWSDCLSSQQVQGHAYQNRDEFMEHVKMMHRNSVIYNGTAHLHSSD